MIKKYFIILLLILISCSSISSNQNLPISGNQLDCLIEAQAIEFQNYLRSILPEKDGFLITGPIKIDTNDHSVFDTFNCIRVISPPELIIRAESIIAASSELTQVTDFDCTFPGNFMEYKWNKSNYYISICTINQNRILFWADQVDYNQDLDAYKNELIKYFDQIDNENYEIDAPKAIDHNLTEEYDIFAPPPDYVIEGYDNFVNYLHSHNEIKSKFAFGITAFIPTDSLLEAMILNAPHIAFPNKEAALFQKELKKYSERGGKLNSINTLTTDGFDTLSTGEYFFAVGLNGNIRFGRELSRSEVKRIENETGKNLARANHSFLFPGETILTAGAFFIELDENELPIITKVNAQSGHYFYSNINKSIKDDISVRSNEYLMTLGHFFRVLKKLNLPYKNILMSKM